MTRFLSQNRSNGSGVSRLIAHQNPHKIFQRTYIGYRPATQYNYSINYTPIENAPTNTEDETMAKAISELPRDRAKRARYKQKDDLEPVEVWDDHRDDEQQELHSRRWRER